MAITIWPIKEIADIIHTEELSDNEIRLALQRSKVEKLQLNYITDKGWYRKYQYVLLLKSNSEDDIQRLKNLDWLDNLSDWIEKQNYLKNYPNLENKQIKEISCDNAIKTETNKDGLVISYYLQFYFNIRGGI